MRIEIAVDHIEAEEFVAWLQAQGMDASVGTSTRNFVDGEPTGSSWTADETMRRLWDQFCAA